MKETILKSVAKKYGFSFQTSVMPNRHFREQSKINTESVKKLGFN